MRSLGSSRSPGFLPSPPRSPRRTSPVQARALLARARELHGRVQHVAEERSLAADAVREAHAALRSELVRRELAALPVARLLDADPGPTDQRPTDRGRAARGRADGRRRTGSRPGIGPLVDALEAAGYLSVGQVEEVSDDTLGGVLDGAPEVGRGGVLRVREAVRRLAEAVEERLTVRIDLDPANDRSTALLQAVHRRDTVERATADLTAETRPMARELPPALEAAAPASSRLRMLLASASRAARVHAALVQLQRWTAWADVTRIRSRFDEVEAVLARPGPDRAGVWRDFQRRSPEYYGVLEQVVGLLRDAGAAEGFLPADIADRVRRQDLDGRYRRVALRGYQSFGARFALAQRRVILGDEMGLGKTVQAIAALSHLRATGSTHFLVVCPASVLVNWTREIASRSALTAHRLHGSGRDAAVGTWVRDGGVAVTTFEALRRLTEAMDGVPIAMLVVDEAHYVKNPGTQRSRSVAALADRVDRVLFLTGTPMENRVEEFRRLVDYLQPELGLGLDADDDVTGADAFRRVVAPAYLRRNQEDVLSELPELVEVEEWEEFSRADRAAYRDAVVAENFMAMRRAAFAAGSPKTSAKLGRLLEIVEEAGVNGRKVVVFSYFRDVLDTVCRALGSLAFGPLTGDVPATERQDLVDAFSAADGHAVLVSQILAGGVGVNMQAASVVVICEPQVKPTMEAQAVARAHRMGQVRKVQVHRLLIADSVDERMLEILGAKSELFDSYARRSDLAECSPEALDLTEADLARQIVALERERLGSALADA
ncbi:MAG: DEAD/DEAH box helicase [Actinomycetales bacterium]|nr:DEAD/DEAH box helicase [Actinomycetales bacterium]